MHNTPAAVSPKPFDLTSAAFLVVAFFTGIAGALQTPTLSLFLTNEVHVRPAMVGFFFTGSAIIGILVSQFLAGRSDRKGDRKSLIVFCCLLGVMACVLFAWNRNYFILLFIGVFLSSFGSTANPQLFALAREHADHTGREAVMFSSVLRAQVSLAWVIGPPLAYALAMGFGFTVMYLSAAVAFVACGALVWFFLPSMRKEPKVATGVLEAPRRNRRDALILFVICTLMWGTNSLYIINMPLFIIDELHLPEKLAGIMMGTAAGLEIPTMLIAGYYAKRFGKRFLMRIAAAAGLLFYIGMLTVHTPGLLLALQLLNAIYIGILAGIGMLYFQDLMPGQAGSATTLYTNTTRVGWIIAGSLAGVVAEIWNYHTVFWIALVMCTLTLGCLAKIKDV
ncbi:MULTISPECIES: sugar efflux transporter SetB [Enterobacter]|jgi:SET family sugar efflux transporter-like MFS transporter|uniref:Sugar efflux transporter SetB n=1 Tax=Enterobacter rongchengensis TaxID=3030999 RepID=A0ABV4JHB0_9ENTR|nr:MULTISPECIES: sugar efflux transporter SetB [Enterobacter]PNL51645.1 sugar efflux transporter SetB [Enterobacter hormaechei]HCR0839076.1 sugar efflux transporter SetB [Enterobacter cancerogenus]EKX4009353.1 sugar efflux transporter SetB [Enterobacter cloacae]ELV3043448.1 sugar efflux transporter SetB [Enterobacter chengduensis]KJM01066.1 sugar transporter [Enterobacter chengduensis]